MRLWILMAALTAGAFFSQAEEETSVQRLDQAQEGMAEASWPKKPDNRLSPLSGKMKNTQEISVRFFGQDKEFRTKEAAGWQKVSPADTVASWGGSENRDWGEARWNQVRPWAGGERTHQKFQPLEDPNSAQFLSFRQVEREPPPDWASRSTTLAAGTGGSIRMYEGRLTRVREQVWREDRNARELGPARQEKFTPAQVEEILSRPAGEVRSQSRE